MVKQIQEKKLYKFKPFKERIKEISSKQSHQEMQKQYILDALNADDILLTGGNSYFAQELRLWKFLDFSILFQNLYKQLVPLVSTYALLVKNLDQVIELLLANMNTCYQPILTLLCSLYRDCRSEVYPYFISRILPQASQMIEILQLEKCEHVFKMFSFACKFLWKYMLQDITQFYPVYFQILSKRNNHIRRFACESFAYILRRVHSEQMLENILTYVLEFNMQQQQIDLNAEIMYQVLWVINGSMYSRFALYLQNVFEIVKKQTEGQENWFQFVRKLFVRLFDHGSSQTLKELYQQVLRGVLKTNQEYYILVRDFVCHKKGAKVENQLAEVIAVDMQCHTE